MSQPIATGPSPAEVAPGPNFYTVTSDQLAQMESQFSAGDIDGRDEAIRGLGALGVEGDFAVVKGAGPDGEDSVDYYRLDTEDFGTRITPENYDRFGLTRSPAEVHAELTAPPEETQPDALQDLKTWLKRLSDQAVQPTPLPAVEARQAVVTALAGSEAVTHPDIETPTQREAERQIPGMELERVELGVLSELIQNYKGLNNMLAGDVSPGQRPEYKHIETQLSNMARGIIGDNRRSNELRSLVAMFAAGGSHESTNVREFFRAVEAQSGMQGKELGTLTSLVDDIAAARQRVDGGLDQDSRQDLMTKVIGLVNSQNTTPQMKAHLAAMSVGLELGTPDGGRYSSNLLEQFVTAKPEAQ